MLMFMVVIHFAFNQLPLDILPILWLPILKPEHNSSYIRNDLFMYDLPFDAFPESLDLHIYILTLGIRSCMYTLGSFYIALGS